MFQVNIIRVLGLTHKYKNHAKYKLYLYIRNTPNASGPEAVIARLRRSNLGQSETEPVSICKIDTFQPMFLFKLI